WNGVLGVAQYEVYVDDLATGRVQDQKVGVVTAWTPAPLLSGHNYRWWVRAFNSDGTAGVWSNPLDFTVTLPDLIGPKVSTNTITPSLTWNGVTGVAQYEVYVSDLTTGKVQDQKVGAATNWTPAPLVS